MKKKQVDKRAAGEAHRAKQPGSTRSSRIRSTTVLCVRRNGNVVMAGDGQVTMGDSVIKHSARKIRRLYQDKVLAGFAPNWTVTRRAP